MTTTTKSTLVNYTTTEGVAIIELTNRASQHVQLRDDEPA